MSKRIRKVKRGKPSKPELEYALDIAFNILARLDGVNKRGMKIVEDTFIRTLPRRTACIAIKWERKLRGVKP